MNQREFRLPNVKAVALSTAIMCIITCLHLPFIVDANMPPYPFRYTIDLPDGTKSPPLRMNGDARYHWEETEDGFTVIDDPDGSGYLMIAERDETTGKLCSSGIKVGEGNPQKRGIQKHINPTSEAVRAECGAFCEADEYGNPPASTMGNGSRRHRNMRQLSLEEQNNRRDLIATANKLKNLVILIRFSDHQDRNLPSESQYDELFNGSGPSASAPTGSVNDVYLQSSHGSLAIESTVYPWITLSKPEIYYADGRNGFTGKFFEAIHEALDVIDNDPTINIADFNTDYDKGDRFIDAITFLHSGYGAEFSSNDCYDRRSTDRIWSHKWAMHFGPGQWKSQDGKVKVYNYHVSPGLWGTCRSEIGRIGVIAHEMGHFLGVPDLYDGTPSGGKGIGSWGLMSNSWGFDGSQKYPPIMSAWSKVKLGWVEPKVITRSGQYAIQASYEQPDVYKVEAGYPDGEYLLIENRQAGGFDFKVPSGGLAIWHIDESADNNSGYPGQSEWPLNGRHYAVSLVQADGRYDLERGRGSGDAGDLFRGGGISLLGPSEGDVLAGPFPNTDSYQGGNIQRTGNQIFDISPSSNIMTFSFTSPLLPTDAQTDVPTNAPTPRPSPLSSETPSSTPSSIPSSGPSHLPSEVPSSVPTSMPSFGPTSLPSIPAPSLSPSTSVELQRSNDMITVLTQLSGHDSIADMTSPQRKALDWMLHHDGLQLNAASPNFVQRYSISTFYFATTNSAQDHWDKCGADALQSSCPFESLRFLSSNNECNWFGITCNANNEITRINMKENGLTGSSVPKELASLSSLEVLHLSKNDLSSTIPSEFGLLTNLKYLYLNNNNFIGTIPTSLGNIHSLTLFAVGNDKMNGTIPGELFHPTLKYLDMDDNDFHGTLPSEMFTSSINLMNIDMGGNRFEGTIPAGFGNLDKLKLLRMNSNNFIGKMPQELFLPPSLHTLNCSNNNLNESLPDELYGATSLRVLNLASNNFSGTISNKIGDLKYLQELKLQSNQLEGTIPSMIGLLSRLRSMDIKFNSLNGSMPDNVCHLKGSSSSFLELSSDCGGFLPLVACDCCSTC